MRMKNIKFLGVLCSLTIFASLPLKVQAGGAFSTTKEGDPVLWDQGKVFFRMDPGGPEDSDVPAEPGGGGGGGGGCFLAKPAYAAATIKGLDAQGMVTHAFKQWSDQTNGGLTITQGPDLPENVTFANAENFYVGSFVVAPFQSTVTADPCYNGDQANCLNSVIVDPHGLITDGILGQCARFAVFGFASILPQRLDDAAGTITNPLLKAAQLVINGTCVKPVDPPWSLCAGNPQFGFEQCPIELDQTGIQGVVTHEIGHFLGLDHVMVQKDLYLKCSPDNAGCTADELEKIPTMIGLAVPGINLDTLTQDDKSAIKGFYPGGSGECKITGVVQTDFAPNNGRCLEVIATKTTDPSYVVGGVSGAYVKRFSQGISCSTTNDNGEMDAGSYQECVNGQLLDAEGKNIPADQRKIHTNCSLTPDQCGQFEIAGVDAGTYNISIQTFVDPNGGLSIPFILEPCDQVRNDSGITEDKVIKKSNFQVNCPGDNNAGTLVIQ
jgi:hypothetical protein